MGIAIDLLQFNQERQAGKIARLESETMAKQEEVAAIAREADRKRRLADALASQVTTAGASGVAAFEGSPLSVMREDSRREAQDTQRDRFMTNLSASTTRYRGVIAEKQAKTGATLGLIRNAEKRAMAFL